ncbi:spore germination protein [Anaeromicrobium sediminis]|uniref:Spore germination protein n=1 Tax=Anaeromicrobium sediminis TaxID=1478221 RepID=A0A267MBX4_9FIRM|nr:spore germination protein [Anaeromicrobium sediminis]PAB56310.1 spore germination protein [Anaeromicrobium sediminis]
MSFFDDLFKKKEEPIKNKTSSDYKKNVEQVKKILGESSDLSSREFEVGNTGLKGTVIFIEGLVNTDIINQEILRNVMLFSRSVNSKKDLKNELFEVIKNKTVTSAVIVELEDIDKIVGDLMNGIVAIFIEGESKVLMVEAKSWPTRGVGEPSTESIIRGPSDGFVETLRSNTALIRRRIKDPTLRIQAMILGKRSKTDVAVMYIEETVDKRVLKEVKERLDKIDIDAILESGYVEQFIEDSSLSPFPQIQSTQRPDVVAAALYDGRVAIGIDNTPFVLIVPATIVTFLQSPEDYNDRFILTSFLRILRFASFLASIFMPSIYIAITAYHPDMLPADLALYVAGSRMNVPFPPFIEIFIMEITLELLREAGERLPSSVGGIIGIVGGLVLGQAAVEAGIVSPLLVIVVAVTAIASSVMPNYSISVGLRIFRFTVMIFASMLGLYGIVLGAILILTHLCTLDSFGIAYLTPFVSTQGRARDFKDSFIKMPIQSMKKRSAYLQRQDSTKLNIKDGGKYEDK